MSYSIHLQFTQIPKSLNKALRTHYHKYNKQKKEWNDLVYLLTRSNLPHSPLTKAKLKIVRHYYRTLDYDGLVGSLKPVVDGLTNAGIIKDDSWGVLGAWDVTQEFRPKKDGPLLDIYVSEEI